MPVRAAETASKPTSDQIIDELKSWIIAQNGRAVAMDVDTDIIENRLVDSLNFINFLLLLEERRGAEIPESEVDAARFRTLRTIQANFLS